MTLALCVCCLLVPKNSRFLCPAPPSLFLSHFCLSLLSSFSYLLPLYSLLAVFFLLSHPFSFYFIPLTLPHYLSLPHSSSPIILIFLPICNCVPFHSFLLNPLISSLPPPSLHLSHFCLTFLLAPPFPPSLCCLPISLLDLEHPLNCLSLTSPCISCFLSPSSHFSSVSQPVCLVSPPAAGCLSSVRSRASLLSR